MHRGEPRKSQFARLFTKTRTTISHALSALLVPVEWFLGLAAQAPAVRDGPPYLLRGSIAHPKSESLSLWDKSFIALAGDGAASERAVPHSAFRISLITG
jgi:hypothetical protein